VVDTLEETNESKQYCLILSLQSFHSLLFRIFGVLILKMEMEKAKLALTKTVSAQVANDAQIHNGTNFPIYEGHWQSQLFGECSASMCRIL
jgi:hypothetical protein